MDILAQSLPSPNRHREGSGRKASTIIVKSLYGHILQCETVRQCGFDTLDSEPISHLVEGVEAVGGRANVFVHTSRGVVALSVLEYKPNDEE